MKVPTVRTVPGVPRGWCQVPVLVPEPLLWTSLIAYAPVQQPHIWH